MTDKEKINKLNIILAKPIIFYKEKMASRGEDYVYDGLPEQFNLLSRSELLAIVETIVKE